MTLDAASLMQPIRYTIDINSGLVTLPMQSQLMKGDKNANRVIVDLKNGDTPVMLTHVTVSGSFIRPPDGASIPLAGSAEENIAIVALRDECYAHEGYCEIHIKLTIGETARTILRLTGHVLAKGTGATVDIDGVIPSIDDIIDQYATMQRVTQETEAARDAAIEAAQKSPYIDVSTNNWFVWDAVNSMYVDTGVRATGPQGPAGANGTGSGTVVSVTVNGQTYEADETGDVDLGTIAGGAGGGVSSVTINGNTFTPDANGNVAATISQIRRGVVYAQPYNNTAVSEYGLQMINNQDGKNLYLLSLLASPDILYYQATGGSRRAVYSEGNPPPYPVKTATINGKSCTPDANGNIDLGTIGAGSGSVSSVTINGTKYTPDASGDVAATVSQVKRGVTNLQPYNNNAVTEYGLQAYNTQTGKSLYMIIRDAAPNTLRIISANTSQDVFSTLNPPIKTATVTFAFNGESLWHYAEISGVTSAAQIISILSTDEGFWATGLIYDNTLGILTQFRDAANVYAYPVEAQVAYMV